MESSVGWRRLLEAIRLPPEAYVLAIGSRAPDPLAAALADDRPDAQYVALSLGGEAMSAPEPIIAGLTVTQRAAVRSLEDICAHLKSDHFHLIAFLHALDDMVQMAVARHEVGLTPDETEAVLRAVRAYWRSGDLERIAVPSLLEVIEACRTSLRPGGHLAFSHEVLDLDLRQGHPLELYAEYVVRARSWISAAGLPLREIEVAGLDPQWWICLQRTR
jgi:hypothetical protein